MKAALFLVFLLAGCVSRPGWQGDGIHVVDETWLGSETACDGQGATVECRAIAQAAMETLSPALRAAVATTSRAQLPTRFVTASGETRAVRLTSGLDTLVAVVLDLKDGSRRVIGTWCYLANSADGTPLLDAIHCRTGSLQDWREGGEPPAGIPGVLDH